MCCPRSDGWTPPTVGLTSGSGSCIGEEKRKRRKKKEDKKKVRKRSQWLKGGKRCGRHTDVVITQVARGIRHVSPSVWRAAALDSKSSHEAVLCIAAHASCAFSSLRTTLESIFPRGGTLHHWRNGMLAHNIFGLNVVQVHVASLHKDVKAFLQSSVLLCELWAAYKKDNQISTGKILTYSAIACAKQMGSFHNTHQK